VIALSVRKSGRPLANLTRDDDEAGPNGTVKEDPANEHIDHREYFYQHYARIERCGRH
jgi:hypothetical protein